MTPPKLTINFHPEPNGKGKPIKQGQTFEGKGDGSEPEPAKSVRPRIPGMALSMTMTFDEPVPAVVQDSLPNSDQ